MSKDDIIGTLGFILLWVLIYSVIHVWIWIQKKHPLEEANLEIGELKKENFLLEIKLKEANTKIENYEQKEEIEDLKKRIHSDSAKKALSKIEQIIAESDPNFYPARRSSIQTRNSKELEL